MTDAPLPPSFTRGVTTAIAGLRMAVGNAAVRRAYLRVVLALLSATVLLDAVGLWALFHFVDPDGRAGPSWGRE